jgi:hypothetical protein
MRRCTSATDNSDSEAEPPTVPVTHPGKVPRDVAASEAMPRLWRKCRRFFMSIDPTKTLLILNPA